jgi:hypothetical protein
MTYIMNSTGFLFFVEGKTVKINKDSYLYGDVLKMFQLSPDLQDQELERIISLSSGNFRTEGFEITPSSVTFEGEEIPEPLAGKVRSIVSEGLPATLFINFWKNLQANPSGNSVRELYDFLAYKELPITEDGCFLAYKGVDKDLWSIHGNTKTKVLKGKTNSSGKILNEIGAEIEVRRWDVDDNREHHCSYGLHVGSLDYAKSFGQSILVVKVNPRDVVSVPKDCECQKCRVSAYTVVSVMEQEITSSVTDDDGEPYVAETDAEQEAVMEDIEDIISFYRENFYGRKEICLDELMDELASKWEQDFFSHEILGYLSKLGYTWRSSGGITMIQI